jgi:putative addiction module component (TIGR02574 family)
MTRQATELLNQALQLSDAERGDLAARLIDSLDDSVETDAENAWSKEVRERLTELDTGAARAVPWDEARRMILDDSEESCEP